MGREGPLQCNNGHCSSARSSDGFAGPAENRGKNDRPCGGCLPGASPHCQRKKKVQKEKTVAGPVRSTRKTTLAIHRVCMNNFDI